MRCTCTRLQIRSNNGANDAHGCRFQNAKPNMFLTERLIAPSTESLHPVLRLVLYDLLFSYCVWYCDLLFSYCVWYGDMFFAYCVWYCDLFFSYCVWYCDLLFSYCVWYCD